MKLDELFSHYAFELYDGLRRCWVAYSQFLMRFRVTGIKRVIVDLFDDAATFGTVFALGVITFALPTLNERVAIWY